MTQAPDEKCIWCNRSGGVLRTIELPAPNQFPHGERHPRLQEALVHPEHESRTREFVEAAHHKSGRFVVVMAFLPLIVCVPLGLAMELSAGEAARPFWTGVLLGPVIVLLGLFVLRHPFATPQTTRFLGLKYSIWLVRVAAALFVAQGIWLLGWGLS